MTVNIVHAVQQKMGFQTFDKINANLQQGKTELENSATTDPYHQAATIAVLTGLYYYGTTEKGATVIAGATAQHPLQAIFQDKEEEVIKTVACFGKQPYATTEKLLQQLLRAALVTVQEAVGKDAPFDKVRTYLTNQRHYILVYLPPELKIGKMFNDESIDDRTNKMEGPVSNMMHAIERLFSTKDETKQTQ